MQINYNLATNKSASRCFSCGYTVPSMEGATVMTVTLYYGTTDGGINASAWQYNRPIANSSLTWNIASYETVSTNTLYYYRFYVYTSNGSSAWSSSTQTITTLSTVADVRTYIRPAFGGYSVCSAISRGGTMGLVCYKGSQKVLLSNWHVIAANVDYSGSLNIGSIVYAPSISDGGGIEYPIGTLSDIQQVQMLVDPFNPFNNTMDASIANIANPNDTSFNIPDIGTPIDYSDISLGDIVYHQGRTTGYSYGTVDYIGSASTSYGSQTAYFSEVYIASCFCMSGDSGSAVFKKSGGSVYFSGLVFAGSLSDGIQATFCKASSIVTRFGLSFSSAPSSNPIINVNQNNFVFNSVAGSASPANQTLTISNSGQGTLSWFLTKTKNWLSLSMTSGTNSGSVVLSINTTGLAAGNYSDTITITASGATNTPQTVTVSLVLSGTNWTKYTYLDNWDSTGSTGAVQTSWKAQTFTPTINHLINRIRLKLFRSGTFSDSPIFVSVKATDVNGVPTGPDLNSTTVSTSTITVTQPSTAIWVNFDFYTGVPVYAGTKYAIVWYQVTGDLNNNIQALTTNNTYAGGNLYYSVTSGTTWVALTSDALFEEWGSSTSSNAPIVNNSSGATSITSTTATLNGNLVSSGGITTSVKIYWGTIDCSTSSSSWANTINIGNTGESSFSSNIGSLQSNTTYYYRCYASNSVGGTWASSTASFVTTTTITLPSITNSSGATSITSSSAVLNGYLTSTGNAPTTVYIYWGLTDGGTTIGNWSHAINLGVLSISSFNSIISGLTASTLYCYRCYAVNSAGGTWASGTTTFTTLSSGSSGITLILPTNGSTVSGTVITFDWSG